MWEQFIEDWKATRNLRLNKEGKVARKKHIHSYVVRISVVAPTLNSPFIMAIDVPRDRDAEEYIDEYLEGILKDDIMYDCTWNFCG